MYVLCIKLLSDENRKGSDEIHWLIDGEKNALNFIGIRRDKTMIT